MRRLVIAVLFVALGASTALGQMIDVNVLLNAPPSAGVIAQLEAFGPILDTFPEISAIRVRAHADYLASIQGISGVVAANPDAPCTLATATEGVTVPDFGAGANLWNLDAIGVTDFGTTRTVAYDGAGVYVAVIDSGLQHKWRDYFPGERIATQFGIAFGGSENGNNPTVPNKWEHDTNGHGTQITSIILGFSNFGPYFNGVAPLSTIIPVRVMSASGFAWNSKLAQGCLHAANLKASGALGGAPLVILFCVAAIDDPIIEAAINYAIAQGAIVVAAAGNFGGSGMSYPAAYPQVISVAATGWVGQWPADDPTALAWIQRDVPEGNPLDHFIASFSSRALPGQDLDVAAPGTAVPSAFSFSGQVDHSYFFGTSAAAPHVAGVVALMLQKNPSLTQAQVEAILESTAMPIAPGCRQITGGGVSGGGPVLWSNFTSKSSGVFFLPETVCWGADATGHGLLQAGAALAATP